MGLTRRRFLLALLLTIAAVTAHAQGRRIDLPTRAGVTTALYWAPAAGARTTLLLFPGGAGGFGSVEGGWPTGENFLVRSAPLFSAQGFNVAILGRPSDLAELGFADRIGDAHLADVRHAIDHLRRETGAPVWLVATSRGTISAAAAAIRDPAGIAGLVLSASVTDTRRPGALPRQDLSALRLPVLLVHHRDDSCPICRPQDVAGVLRAMANATPRRAMLLEGGGPPDGDACGPRHWHGFVGIEQDTVARIAGWIRQPTH